MLLRLRVKNFKNLEDVEIRFGPLTCFVGTNGVGKSNILDAIQFLRSIRSIMQVFVSGGYYPRGCSGSQGAVIAQAGGGGRGSW